ncbi:hypothetical protein AB0I81_41140 [Nonomuraea sp. NPDC050404]|uniref:hypothetical protein n=1 Tax=Nonomuraea sp. NPDC050404 TaxID=3155783 RepID=UPI0033E76F79
MTLGVPVIVVLVGVVRWRSARVGGVLALFGVVQPLVRPYFDPVVCADVRLFSGQWFGRVGEALRESTSVSLLVAAVLVLVATQVLGPANDPAAAVAWRPVVRRVVGFLFCYWTLGLLVVVMDEMAVGYLNAGLLYWLSTASVLDNPWPLLVALVMIAYVPVRRAIAERRRG